MKRSTWLAAAVVACIGAWNLLADTGEQTPAPARKYSWTPIQLVVFPGVPPCILDSNIRGLKVGIPCSGGTGSLQGVEASFLYSGTSYGHPESEVEGIQCSWFGPCIAQTLSGVQATQLFAYANNITGFQAAPLAFLRNDSVGFQFGCGVVAMNGFDGFQAGAATVTAGNFNGCQLGVVNVAPKECTGAQLGGVAVAGDTSGCQFNIVNIITKVSKAFQVGAVNYSQSGGIQFGAINIIADSWLPVMILCNFKL